MDPFHPGCTCPELAGPKSDHCVAIVGALGPSLKVERPYKARWDWGLEAGPDVRLRYTKRCVCVQVHMKKASVCVCVCVCVCLYVTVAQGVSVCALAPPPGHVLVYHIVCMCIIISRRYIRRPRGVPRVQVRV